MSGDDRKRSLDAANGCRDLLPPPLKRARTVQREDLHEAILAKDTRGLAALLAQAQEGEGQQLWQGLRDDIQLLQTALDTGDVSVFMTLVKMGFEFDSGAQDVEALLHSAAAAGRLDVVQCLLDLDVALDRPVPCVVSAPRTPLMAAAGNGHLAVVEKLLEAGAPAEQKVGKSCALLEAAGQGRLEVVQRLLTAGVEHIVEFEDCHLSAACAAAEGGHSSVVQALCQHVVGAGFPLDSADELADVEAGGMLGRTPLLAAAQAGHLETCRVLIEEWHSGVDGVVWQHVVGSGGLYTSPLAAAAGKGHQEVVELLLHSGAQPSADAVTVAVAEHHWEVAWHIVRCWHLLHLDQPRGLPLQPALLHCLQTPDLPALGEILCHYCFLALEGVDPQVLLAAALLSDGMLKLLLKVSTTGAGGTALLEAPLQLAMLEAAKADQWEALERLLGTGTQLREVRSPSFVLAVLRKRPHLLATLREAGLDIDAHDIKRFTPLTRAFQRREYDLVEQLLDLQATAAPLSAKQVVSAARLARPLLGRLLEAGACPAAPDVLTYDTAFSLARSHDRGLYNRLMQEVLSSPSLTNRTLATACRVPGKLLPEIKVLLSSKHADANARDPQGWLALSNCVSAPIGRMCSAEQARKVLRMLLEAGADVNACSKRGMSPLMYATHYGYNDAHWHELVADLVKAGADVSAMGPDYFDVEAGYTPLMRAARCRRSRKVQTQAVKVARVLLDAGADPNAAGLRDSTALLLACSANNYPMVELLLQRGARTEPVSPAEAEGGAVRSALMCAAEHPDPKLTQLLLRHGADPNYRGDGGLTALDIAAEEGHGSVAAALLKGGANPNLVNENRLTPLQRAAQRGHVHVAKQLKKHGARLDAKMGGGMEAAQLAELSGNSKLAMLLKEPGLECVKRERALRQLHPESSEK